MSTIRNFCFLLLIIVSFISCRHTYYSPREITANTDVSITDIELEELNIENCYPRSLLAVDSMVVVFSYDKEAMIKVFDYTGKQLAKLSPSGRAKNEFISVRYAHQKRIINGERYLYVVDPTQEKYYLYNLSASMRQGYNETPTVLMKKDRFLRSVYYREDGSYFTYKSISYDDARDLIFYPPEYSLIGSNGKTKKFNIVPDVMDFSFDDAFPEVFFHDIVRISDDGNRIVSVPFYEDRMTFINLESYDCFGVRGKDFIDIAEYNNTTVDAICNVFHEAVSQVCVSDDFIYVLYDNRTINEADELGMPRNTTIRVFNWDGVFLAELKPNVELFDMSIDSDNGILLGLDEDNRMYYSNLPESLFKRKV